MLQTRCPVGDRLLLQVFLAKVVPQASDFPYGV